MSTRAIHQPALDGVRGFAAAIVVFFHAVNQLGGSLLAPPVLSGTSGVYLFFVLSAYLLTKQFFVSPRAMTHTPAFVSEFLFRRCARIVPLYWLALLTYYSVQFVVPGKRCVVPDAAGVFKSMLMNAGYGHFWTIPVEFIFYFILPAVALFALGTKSKAFVLAVFAGFIALSALLLTKDDHGVAAHAFVFVAGSALAVIDVYCAPNRSPPVRHALALCGTVAVVLFFTTRTWLVARGWSWVEVEGCRLYWSVIATMLLAGTLWGATWLSGLFAAWPLRFLGTISFSVYIWHILVNAIVHNLASRGSPELRHVLAWGGTIVVGWLSFRYLEMIVYRSPRARAFWANAVDSWIVPAAR